MELDGFRVLGGADKVEGEVADDGHVLGAEALSQSGLVVVEGDIEHLVQAVLDAPVRGITLKFDPIQKTPIMLICLENVGKQRGHLSREI